MGMSRILDDRKAMFLGNGLDAIHVSRIATIMYDDGGLGLRCDGRFHGVGVDIEGSGIDIDKNGDAIHQGNGGRTG